MKAPLIPALALLTGLACANTPAAPAPSAAEPPAAEQHELSPSGRQADEKARRQYHNALNGLLVFIHDTASADAAAPKIAALLATSEGKKLKLPNFTLISCYSYDFFASAALKKALLPVLPKEPQGLEKLTTLLAEATGHLDAVTAALGEVKDSDTEKQAIESLQLHLPEAGNALVRANSAATHCAGPSAFKAHGQPMLALDRLLHAYGHAKGRIPGGCPALADAMDAALREHMEQTAFYDPHEITAENIHRHEAQAAALHEWFGVAAGIHDTATADAAADWLEKKNAELGVRLNSIPDHRIIAESPCLTLLEEAEANIYLYLVNAEAPFFGSGKLAALYAPEPTEEEGDNDEGTAPSVP